MHLMISRTLLVCKTVEGLVVCLGEELVVEDPFGEREPVPLVLPQSDLVRDRRRKLAIAALQHLKKYTLLYKVFKFSII